MLLQLTYDDLMHWSFGDNLLSILDIARRSCAENWALRR